MLKVQRTQLPLAPAFAITAYASQGQTLRPAIVDLRLGKGTSIITAYVAFTRVTDRSDLLIYRPFAHTSFRGGPVVGPDPLMKVLRGESVDWAELDNEPACVLRYRVTVTGLLSLHFGVGCLTMDVG